MLGLNTIGSSSGARQSAIRVGRGAGKKGKTCGRGHKGQKSRSGGKVRVGFEGGQMPIYRRLPKFGFKSRVSFTHTQLGIDSFNAIDQKVLDEKPIDLPRLKELGLVNLNIKTVKIFLNGDCEKKLSFKGIKLTKGAVEAVEKKKGSVE